jgi:hypothetical protein
MNQEKNTLVGRSAISSTDACIIMDQIFEKEVCTSEAAVSNKQNQDSVFFLLFHIASSDPSDFITLLHMLTMNWTNSEHLLSGCYLW